ncbi:hypothetical protein [Spirosoma utsteinense]|uniref:NfeD-like C-terminal domain-containing protein n=1 Tax=Spirosoma utsteinense TaxID=2585773 RepID=A0ABR6VZK9_9BACT|nr:hypothetical protein [Spirosoma utsteinense]MBC3784689.1 hypothetical protein [Spirosoma utsteinense]MBC3789557.1 hypothetical protein [Spirosoma utsteinense]
MHLTVFPAPVSLALLSLSLLTSCASPKPFSRKGIVQQIKPGKDGYTASLRDRHGIGFDALVSRVRLQQAYRVLKVGDQVKVVGDTIHLNQRVRVLVTQIR